MNDYYITIDEDNNVIDAFTTGFRPPEAGDIMIEENKSERCWSLSLRDEVTGQYRLVRDESDPRGYREKTEAEIMTPEVVAEIEQNQKLNNIRGYTLFLFKALSQLITKLLADGVISAEDFDADTRAEYIAIKALVKSLDK